MCQTGISLWFVCRLCRGSFGQVDAFIEHKKQKHFTQFQNTTSIVFEEGEQGLLYPFLPNNGDHLLAFESNDPPIKIEVSHEDPINNPFSSEIIDEPNLDLVEPKSELITYESEIIPDNENNFFGLQQPEQNPYVLLKRLTSKEIQRACVPIHHFNLLTFEQKNFPSNLEPLNLSSVKADSNISNLIKVENSAENESTTTVEPDLSFECKLCSKQLESDAQLKIHLGICALSHKHRNRFCVTCNRKCFSAYDLKYHRLRFHGTEEEKSSLYKYKCHVCSKKYQKSSDLRFHLDSHKTKKQQVETSESKPMKCSSCGKGFRCNSELQRHISTVHLGVKPFSCHFPNCNKNFSLRGHLNIHLRTHTGERPFKCTVDSCNKAFITPHERSVHHGKFHFDL